MTETRTVTVEREFRFPPEKIWRALTQTHLIEDWLMKNDFSPEPGSEFTFAADWGAVEGKVLEAEENRSLSYSWDTKDLRSVITWTLTPTETGTQLRMEQTGFLPEQRSYYQGAMVGWPRFFDALRDVLENMD